MPWRHWPHQSRPGSWAWSRQGRPCAAIRFWKSTSSKRSEAGWIAPPFDIGKPQLADVLRDVSRLGIGRFHGAGLAPEIRRIVIDTVRASTHRRSRAARHCQRSRVHRGQSLPRARRAVLRRESFVLPSDDRITANLRAGRNAAATMDN